jgi:hypothetical protein
LKAETASEPEGRSSRQEIIDSDHANLPAADHNRDLLAGREILA